MTDLVIIGKRRQKSEIVFSCRVMTKSTNFKSQKACRVAHTLYLNNFWCRCMKHNIIICYVQSCKPCETTLQVAQEGTLPCSYHHVHACLNNACMQDRVHKPSVTRKPVQSLHALISRSKMHKVYNMANHAGLMRHNTVRTY